MSRPRLNLDALIFSCYDVLIDVSLSYREVVRRTVQLYLEQAIGMSHTKEALITPDEVLLLQKAGQFTNYWDLTTAFVIYFIEMLPAVPAPTFPSKFHVPGIMAYLQLAGGNLRVTPEWLRDKKDIAKLAADIAAAGGGINGADKALPRENRHLLVADGDINRTNIVGRIFQELYLGADLFERIYNVPAIIIQSTGYAEHESLVIEADILTAISKKVPLGVISDRPRGEVERSLKARNIYNLFKTIITLDEINQAKAKPVPDPWPLITAARQLHSNPSNVAYVGANIGDIQAARAANKTIHFTTIGCLVNAHNKYELRDAFAQNKVNMILGHPNNLKELILG